MTATLTHALWRNPNDRSDPIDLAHLDEQTRKATEDDPYAAIEQVDRMRG